MDDGLQRTGNMYCGVWCRSMQYDCYDNVYAVNLGIIADSCIVRAHKVVGCLANGDSFGGFLIPSMKRNNAMTLLSQAHVGNGEGSPNLPHWVIVEARSSEDAIASDDVASVREELMNPYPKSFNGVYFASNGKGCVKVGQTTYPLETRLAQLQAGSPYKLYVCASITTDDRKAVEKRIHQSLKSSRLHGEWFSMSDAEAIAIAKQHGGREVSVGRKKRVVTTSC